MPIEFQVLRDIEVRVNGERLELGHARQRCVLLAMLLDVNRPVPLEHLVDRVWFDHPPRNVRNSLAGYISRLRTLFADTDEVVISREPAGYVLAAEPLSVDLYRFRHIVSQARASADPVEAARLFAEALEMWPGEPFVLLDTPWVNEVRGVLLEERLSVELNRYDVALRAGLHADLLVDMSRAHAANPLDERLAGQLMLAHYGCGRQADALNVYRQMRRRLADELGVDPGPLLSQVHQQILRHGPEQRAARSAAPAGPPVIDRPRVSGPLRRASSFIGRECELGRVGDALRAGPLVTLCGVGGVGKTRLAMEVAQREQTRFVDGVWICELAPLLHDEAVKHAVAASLRLLQRQGLDLEESVIEYLRTRAVLLVVDNCEHVVEAAAGLVDRIVKNCPQVSVLATSRQPLGVEGERVFVVSPLTIADATRLFADRATASHPEFALDDQPLGTVAEICQRVDCLPLGVELAAARMRAMSSRDVARHLDHLSTLRSGTHDALPRQQSLVQTIDWSYRLLTPAEQALFARLSVFAGGFDLDAAYAVCGADADSDDDTLELLISLVDKSMVTVHRVTERTRYGILETLRSYARRRLQEHGLEKSFVARHAAYYTALAERAAVGMHGADEGDWVERILPDHDNLRSAFEHATAAQDFDAALRMVTSLPELVGLRISYEPADWAERVIAVADPEHPLFVAAVGTAARAAWNRGEYRRARQLATLARGRTPPRGTARVSYPDDVLADVALFEGDAQGALAYWEGEASRAFRTADPIRLTWTLYSSAICHGLLGTPDVAIPNTLEAVRVADATGNPTARSMAYFALSFLLKKSDPIRALALLDEAAQLAGATQNSWAYGTALTEAAATRAGHGDPATAAKLFLDVIDHWERVGDWTQQWLTLRYITRLLVRLHADDDAVFINGALVNMGKAPALKAAQWGVLADRLGPDRFNALNKSDADGAAALARARASLRRYVNQPPMPVR